MQQRNLSSSLATAESLSQEFLGRGQPESQLSLNECPSNGSYWRDMILLLFSLGRAPVKEPWAFISFLTRRANEKEMQQLWPGGRKLQKAVIRGLQERA